MTLFAMPLIMKKDQLHKSRSDFWRLLELALLIFLPGGIINLFNPTTSLQGKWENDNCIVFWTQISWDKEGHRNVACWNDEAWMQKYDRYIMVVFTHQAFSVDFFFLT